MKGHINGVCLPVVCWGTSCKEVASVSYPQHFKKQQQLLVINVLSLGHFGEHTWKNTPIIVQSSLLLYFSISCTQSLKYIPWLGIV